MLTYSSFGNRTAAAATRIGLDDDEPRGTTRDGAWGGVSCQQTQSNLVTTGPEDIRSTITVPSRALVGTNTCRVSGGPSSRPELPSRRGPTSPPPWTFALSVPQMSGIIRRT